MNDEPPNAPVITLHGFDLRATHTVVGVGVMVDQITARVDVVAQRRPD